ncbi:MAG: coproporphyrinogen-III oxidase family protein, partial [Hyphomonadaceae bacterium]
EANPDDKDALADFAAAGVNRLSLGVQSLDDKRLAFLGRTHSAADALAALDQARGLFPSVSLDLIYALPGQGGLQWEGELTRALRLGCDHLSLYELTIEPGAAFAYAVRRGEWTPAPDDAAAELYDLTSDLCEASGYAAYEISNHARAPQHESRHNRVYWASGDWVGVGPGAHGRLTTGGVRSAVEAAARPPEYIEQVEKTGVGWLAEERLTPLDQVRERIAMGLRVREGFARADVTELGFDIDAGALARLSGQGLVSDDGRRIALTPKGRLFADRIAAELSP